ncbi:serine hydrolase domain-containing protein [Simiduia curdlanivorans]|uniref:Serine hydrolase domain-containing protein n=1 Tax=Simiduia curdlanivorans TaxID=1492769 RepID=A0ABV8V6J1_9GAMM|nr:serine hydrolase domain-containing protein [Simiduia curdlanivorans]MDN3640522.1 serine hydrolase domain-containing protein [Simiduia curdlanivorans]
MSAFPSAGAVASGFEPVAQVFNDLLAEAPQGAALAVYWHGQPVVNVWGGARDKAASLAWQADTRVNIFSAGKALVAVAVLQLVAQGKLSLDQPIADIWPGFGAEGKAAITLRQVLSHRSGVNAFHHKVADNAIFDGQQVLALIEQEAPWWQPDTEQGYSPILYGWILAEIVRRASGAASFNEYFQRHVAQPLGLAISFGLAPAEQASLAEVGAMRGAKPEPSVLALGRAMKDEPAGVVNKAFTNPMSLMVGTNGEAWRSAEIPAANGVSSARDLALVYSSLVGDERLLAQAHKALCWQQQSRAVDRILQTEMRFSLGFMLTQAGADRRLGRGDKAFGHAGAGGCLGFADPEYGIGFGFVSNQMAQSLLIDSRGQRLIDAVYSCLETEAKK